MPRIRRRDLLLGGACLFVGAGTDLRPTRTAAAQAMPSDRGLRLPSFLSPEDGEIYSRRGGRPYDRLSIFYNKRFECVRPQTIIYCRTPRAVGRSIRWCRENSLSFAVRSGGHCYEGTSRSDHVVIDVRGLDTVELDPARHVIKAGGGASLGQGYATVAPAGQAVAGGTCPSIGMAGHALAGGLGFFVRQFGLACDNILSLEIANAHGDIEIADERSNPDLFWALRGAGQSSFGIVTALTFRTHDVGRVTTYELDTTASPQRTARFMSRWQHWLEAAPESVGGSIFLQKQTPRSIALQLRGAILGDDTAIRRDLADMSRQLPGGRRLQFRARGFGETVRWFSAGEDGRPVYEKGKSDIVKRDLGKDGFGLILDRLPPGVDAEITALGGAVARMASEQTAFPHREPASLVIQWGIAWERPEQARARLSTLDDFYAAIRPLMSSSAFLNYADRDLADPARAYWGPNLERLVAVKQRFDPDNVFRHALSVPLRLEKGEPAAPARRCR